MCSGIIEIAGTAFSYSRDRIGGLCLYTVSRQAIYCQPGDDASAMQSNIDALLEIDCPELRRNIAAMVLGDYF